MPFSDQTSSRFSPIHWGQSAAETTDVAKINSKRRRLRVIVDPENEVDEAWRGRLPTGVTKPMRRPQLFYSSNVSILFTSGLDVLIDAKEFGLNELAIRRARFVAKRAPESIASRTRKTTEN